MGGHEPAKDVSRRSRRLSNILPRRATAADVGYLYRLLLGREARPDELNAQVGRDLLSLVAELSASSDHRDLMRSALAKDVCWLYREMLHRIPESEDVVEHRVGRPLLEVALEFARSEEFRSKARAATADDVEALYHGVLKRSPENTAVVTSRVGLPLLDVALGVFESPEVRAHQGIDVAELQEWCTLFLGGPVSDAWAHDLVDILRRYGFRRATLLDHLLRMHLKRRGVATPHVQSREVAPPHISLAERPNYAPTKHFGSAIALVVPTIDSEAWIQSVIDFYGDIGVRPVFAVDSRTQDGTRQVLTTARQDWIEVTATAPRIEALLPQILRRVATAWVLRLDDDELPTPEMLAFCDEVVPRSHDTDAWGFPRLCLHWNPSRQALEYSTFLTVGVHADMDRQWRFFRPDRVRLHDAVHSPGFQSMTSAPAPSGALILHFDWVLRTTERRRAKMASYQAQAGSVAEGLRNVLYEDVPEEWHQFEVVEHRQSIDFARRIYHASR